MDYNALESNLDEDFLAFTRWLKNEAAEALKAVCGNTEAIKQP